MVCNKMKKILALCLLVGCVLCAVACGDDDTFLEHRGYKMISNTEIVDYYFYVPDEDYWLVDHQTGMTAAHSQTEGASVSVTTYEPTSDTQDMAAFWAKYEQDFATTYGAGMTYTKVDGIEKKALATTLGGQPAFEYEYTKELLGNTYCVTQVLTMYKNRFYLFTFTGLAGAGENTRLPEYANYSSRIDTGAIKDMRDYFAFK